MKKKNVMYRKSVSLLAAAAMTAVLMTGQIYPVTAWGQNIENILETSSLIPDNVTIDQPVALFEVALPKSEYGTLSWADASFVPDKRVQSCEVVFKPAESVDLSYLSGWDAEKKVVKGKVTVVVSSIEADSESDSSDLTSEDDKISGTDNEKQNGKTDENQDDAQKKDSVEQEDKDNAAEGQDKDKGSAAEGQDKDKDSAAEEQDKDEVKKDSGEDSETASAGAQISQDNLTGAAEETEDVPDDADDTAIGTDAPAESVEETTEKETTEQETTAADQNENADIKADSESNGSVETVDPLEGTGKLNQNLGEAMPGATVLDGALETEEQPAEEDETEGDQKNIFDDPLDFSSSDSRSDSAEENLTEEEQAARAEENHNCDGISVSGIDLPWYVQFQVSSGENYEFRNEEKATIFQSYEFKLWDLKNNTEYEIPDGQYVSVTIPVKEGYEYSIEHLLANGATETIIPSVNGSTMVFSTHSFSPFGIAGFRPIVGDDIANGAYGDGSTPTPTPTVTISGTPTPSPAVTGSAGPGSSAGTDGTSGGSSAGTAGTSGNKGTDGTTGTDGNTGADGTASTNGNSGVGSSGSNNAGITGGSSAGIDGTSGDQSASGTTSGTTTGTNVGATTGTTSGTNGQNQTTNAVKTGDNTVILPFVILVVVAAAVIIVVLIMRRKKNK